VAKSAIYNFESGAFNHSATLPTTYYLALYYGRIKVDGKVIRESLKTSVWTTAKLRLTDFLKGQQDARGHVAPPRFSEAVALFERDLESDTTIKPRSKEYRRLCLKKIETSWPGLIPHCTPYCIPRT
jgi:hypothetical protein